MWLREQGHVFDWGTLKWCQTYATAPNGCYDAETIALDEFGHVDGLGHHVNKDDDSDYLDAVVQTYSRTKPNAGWNVHAFGRCDTATLQLRYDVTTASARYSTCLDLATVLTMSASPTAIVVGGSTTLTATLKVVDDDAYLLIGGNAVSGRTVTLQRRAPGATTWTTVGPMVAGATGTYVLAQQPATTTEYRASFKTPSDEGHQRRCLAGREGRRRRRAPRPPRPRPGSTLHVSDRERSLVMARSPAVGPARRGRAARVRRGGLRDGGCESGADRRAIGRGVDLGADRAPTCADRRRPRRHPSPP